jgi:hypothetical protein
VERGISHKGDRATRKETNGRSELTLDVVDSMGRACTCLSWTGEGGEKGGEREERSREVAQGDAKEQTYRGRMDLGTCKKSIRNRKRRELAKGERGREGGGRGRDKHTHTHTFLLLL